MKKRPVPIHETGYICASLALLPVYNLYGFCWAAIIANTVRLLAFYILGFVQFK